MPVTESIVLSIVCDNPDCPGNDLDPTSRDGWTFVTTEVYGQMTTPQKVYCCPECAGHVTSALQKEAFVNTPPDQKAMVMDAQADGESLPGPTDQGAVPQVSGMRSDQDGHVVSTGDAGPTDPVQ